MADMLNCNARALVAFGVTTDNSKGSKANRRIVITMRKLNSEVPWIVLLTIKVNHLKFEFRRYCTLNFYMKVVLNIMATVYIAMQNCM